MRKQSLYSSIPLRVSLIALSGLLIFSFLPAIEKYGSDSFGYEDEMENNVKESR